MDNSNGKISFAVSLSLEELDEAVRKGQGQIRSLADTAEKEGDRIDDLTKRIGRAAAGLFSVGMAQQFTRQVVQTRGQIQQLEIAFRTLTKSQEKADELMNQLVDTAAKTPFDLMGIADSAKFLLGIRVPVEEVNDTLKMLGDIAAGVGAPLKDIAYLYGTTITKAHMDTMDLRQFTGRGIDLIGELSKQYGIATEQVQQYVAAGKIGAEDFKRAIKSIRETTFNNLMEEQSKSLTGQIANLGDSIDMMMNEIGKKTQGVASGAIGVAAKLVENYEKVGDVIYALITAYGMYKGAQLAAIAAEKVAIMWRHRHALATVTLRRAQEALNKSILTNPYAIAGAAIVGLTSAIIRYATRADAATKASKDFANTQKEISDKVDEQRSKSEQLVNTIRNANETNFARRTAYEQLITLYPDLLSKIDLEKLKTMELVEVMKLLNEERDKAVIKEKENALKQEEKGLAEAMGYRAALKATTAATGTSLLGFLGEKALDLFEVKGGDYDIEQRREKIRLLQEDLEKTKKLLKQTTEEETTEEENGHILTEEELKKLEEARKRAEKEAKERAEAQKQLTEKVIQADFDLRQARIEAMDEGVEREFAANKLAHDRLTHQIDLQVEEWIETYRKATGAKTATFESLSKDQQSTILSMQEEAERAYRRADERALEQALNGIRTYEQEIEKAKEDFSRKRKALRKADGSLADGVTEDNIRELDRQEKEVLTGIDEQFAKREQTYTAFLNRISSLGLEALRQALEEAKQALEEAEANGISGSKLAETKARVKAVTDQITKVESNSGGEEVSDALADWQKLYETLGRVKQSFDDIGESLGGVAGKAIKTAGSIATSAMQMINGITTLANWSIRAQEMTAKGASKAVQAVERASVILAIVGAALQIITKVREVVTSFIDDGKEADREARKFAGTVRSLNSELEVTRDKALAASQALHIFSGNGFADAQRSIKLAEDAFKRYNTVLREQVEETEQINNRFGSLTASLIGATNLEGLQSDVQKYGRIIGNLQIQTRKATGFDLGPFHIGKKAKYQSLRDLVPELFDPDESINKDALAKFIGTEVYDKLPDKVKASLTEVKRAQDEFAEQTKELEGYLRGVFGDLGNDLMNDIVDAFKSGEDASESFAKSVSKTLEKLVSNMIFSSVFSDTFKRAEGEMKALMSKGASQEEFIDFYSQLMVQVKDLKGQADKQLEDAKRAGAEKGLNLFTPDDSKSGERREASRKGLAQASQDSIDELSGRATAIQGHTYDIATYTRQLVTTSGVILGRVTEIRDNTNRLERIEGATDKLRRSMDEITIKGIKVRS